MMINESKMHLIPQAIIDCATDLATTKNENIRINYVMRLETISDYCDQVLKSQNQQQVRWSPPARKKQFSK